MTSVWHITQRRLTMKTTRKASKRSRTTDLKSAAANDTTEVVATSSVEPSPLPLTAEQIATQPEEAPAATVSARTAAIRRSQAGKFNKVVLTQIGGKECPRF